MAPENNIDLLLKVLAQPTLQDQNYSLTIAGDGKLKTDLQQQAETYQLSRRIQWLGTISMESSPELYHSADVFVFTRQDGAPPRVVLEAMSSGLPVVSFIGSGVEDYVQDQYTGLLAERGDLSKFGENLLACMQDDQFLADWGKTEGCGQKSSSIGQSLSVKLNKSMLRFQKPIVRFQ